MDVQSKDKDGLILVVDDQPRNIQLLGNALFGAGYDLIFATSGEEALREARASLPDLILLDVMMPGMDGFEVCRQLKAVADLRSIPVIFVTARSETRDLVTGFDLGAVDYITKPIQVAEVLVRVRNHLVLKRSRDALEELNQNQRLFFSILSHDLNGPLSSMGQLLKSMVEEAEDWDQESFGDALRSCAETSVQLSELLQDSVSWARSQMGQAPKDDSVFHLEDVSAGALRLVHSQALRKKIRIETEIPGEAWVRGDPNVAATVLRNLLSNAVKFTPEGGRILVRAGVTRGGVLVEVSDSGVGMRAERVAVLFDPQARASTPGTADERGSGMGLILCQSLLARQGSKLEVKSEPNQGSVFSFVLPLGDGAGNA